MILEAHTQLCMVSLFTSEELFFENPHFWNFVKIKEFGHQICKIFDNFCKTHFSIRQLFIRDLLCRPLMKKTFFSLNYVGKKLTGGKILLFLKHSSKNKLHRATAIAWWLLNLATAYQVDVVQQSAPIPKYTPTFVMSKREYTKLKFRPTSKLTGKY